MVVQSGPLRIEQSDGLDHLDVDLTQLPVQLDLSVSRSASIVTLVFGGFWLLISGFALFSAAMAGDLLKMPVVLVAPLFLLIGFGIVAGALYMMFSKHLVTLRDDGVLIVRSLKYVRHEETFVRYSEFEGVLMDEVRVDRDKKADIIYQTIELKHRDARLSVLLYKDNSSTPARTRWKEFAQALDVPGLEEDGGTTLLRQPDELDLSLQELAKRRHAYRSDYVGDIGPPPETLHVSQTGSGLDEQLEIVFVASRISAKAYPLLVFMLILFWCIWTFFSGVPMIFPIVGALVVFIAFGFVYVDRRFKRRLTLTREEMRMDDALTFGTQSGRLKHLLLSDVQSIVIDEDRQHSRQLIVNGPAGRLMSGPGLDDDTLTWLQGYLRTAVVTA